jgi:glucan phosphoethanolaminetransferase (alkaline phosphatase superfamily)
MTKANIQSGRMNRRKTSLQNDSFYRMIIGISVVSWLVFVIALMVFHYARPAVVYGMQDFNPMQAQQGWSETLSVYLIILLFVCMLLNILVLVLKRQRTRRTRDAYGVNGFILLFVALGSLVALYFELT